MNRRRPVSGPPGQVFQSSVYLPLRGVAAEVGHQAHAEGVGALPAFYHAQVASRLCQALPEAQAPVILSQRMGLKVSWERQKSQEVGCSQVLPNSSKQMG